jgi:hypothetical protein
MQTEGSFPEEDRSRRPPPSTSSPCPAWSFRLQRPLLRWSETAVQKRLATLQLPALVQFAQKRAPDLQPRALFLPVAQPSPTCRRMRKPLRQVLPASTAPTAAQNPFQRQTVLDLRTAAHAISGRMGEQGRDFFPLRFGQQRPGPRHRLSFGAADPPYPSFHKTQPQSFQRLFQVVQQFLEAIS